MARLVTLATLQTRTLQRASRQYGSGTNSIAGNTTGQPQGELVDAINEGIAELWTILGEVDPPYYQESIWFSTGAQTVQENINGVLTPTATYLIGPGQAINISDFWQFKGLDVTYGQNITITARPFMNAERNRFKWYPGWIYSQPVFYRLTGKASSSATAALDSLTLIPQPSGAFSCKLTYIPTPPVLVNTTDTFDGIMGFEERVVLSAARKLLIQQEQFEHAQILSGLMAEETDRIRGAIAHRDAENPERVQDVTLNDGWIGRPGY